MTNIKAVGRLTHITDDDVSEKVVVIVFRAIHLCFDEMVSFHYFYILVLNICVCIYVYIYIYTHTHTHIYTSKLHGHSKQGNFIYISELEII